MPAHIHTHTRMQDPLMVWAGYGVPAESCVKWEGVFVGADLVQWVVRVGGVREEQGRGVCEGLLRLGVLQKIGCGTEGEAFCGTARYGWTGEVICTPLFAS